jgi:hypothetical protein
MAYSFNGSSQLLELVHANTSPSDYPLTLFVRAKSSDLTNHQFAAIYIRSLTTYNGYGVAMGGTTASDPVLSTGGPVSSVSYADGAWHACTARSTSTTGHTLNVDDTENTGSTSVTFEGYQSIQVGARKIPAFSNGLNGSACCVALWDAALTAAECHSLNVGFSPRRIRPQSLMAYGPLVRDLQSVVNRMFFMESFTNTGSATVSDHPRAYGF